MTERSGGIQPFKRKKVMFDKNQVTTQGREEVEVGTLLLGNDKNNVIADKVSSYF